jgi:hypothetical protein
LDTLCINIKIRVDDSPTFPLGPVIKRIMPKNNSLVDNIDRRKEEHLQPNKNRSTISEDAYRDFGSSSDGRLQHVALANALAR